GPYEIVSALGAGGMGEVYRARDVKLQRDAAIKMLPMHVEADASSVERLQREARAVAALNHPNIVTIYGVDEAEHHLYLAMEFVDGATLADLMPSRGLPLDLLLKYAIPLADALGAAHAQGITHRDLKPSNVMITRDGRVKVLDFGLAQVSADRVQFDASASPTRPITSQGRIVGTVAYMSPEQAAGATIDHRSDLFAFGVLLYEMATGERPFKGEASVSVLASILKDAPKRISEIRHGLPRDLERIVRRALAKDPEQRYQTAKDLRNDLQTLRDDLTSGELNVAAAAAPPSRIGALTWMSLLVAALATATTGYLLYRGRTATPSGTIAMTRVTVTGKASSAAISPDGRYLVHVVADNGFSLWLRQTRTGSDVRIVPPGPLPYVGLTFSRDGDFIYFTRFVSRSSANVYRVSVLGGDPQFVVRDVDSPIAFSSDGSRYAFIRGNPAANEMRVLVGVTGSDELPRVLSARKLPDAYSLGSRLGWSADDRAIVAPVGYFANPGYDDNTRSAMIVAIDASSGQERPLTPRRWDYISAAAPLRDGRRILVAGTERNKLNSQIWSVTADGREIVRLTNDLNDYRDVDIAGATGPAVTILRDLSSTIDVGAPGSLKPVTEGTARYDGQNSLMWTSAGKLIFSASLNGQLDLWMMDADGGNPRPLTSDPVAESHACLLSGDQSIVYVSTKAGRAGIWRQDLSTARLTLLADDPSDDLPLCDSHGPSVIFTRSGEQTLRVGADGGTPVALPPARSFFGSWALSPDGRSIVSAMRLPSGEWGVGLRPLDGGAATGGYDILNVPFVVRWTPRGDALTYIETRRQAPGIWQQPTDGAPAQPVLDMHGDRIVNFAWSPDGRIAVAHGKSLTDVVMFSGVQ
ncbi:MAG TPA: protein kinase, partial [Vicinamibacterales bacterium]|nr:protein kinase [Vicinamibacterales bacterium]